MLLPILAAAAVSTAPAPARAGDIELIYNGRSNELTVSVPRFEAEVTIDGRLDEAPWMRAALLTGFSQFAPLDGLPAADSTEVLVWYSPTAIYFGVRAYEAHGAVHATLADRDKIDADDNIQILLGPFHDHRQAIMLGVNPLGIQKDGTIVESGQALSGGWDGAVAARVTPDLSQDFVFTSKGRLTGYGYEVEIRVPLRSLRYQAADVQTWDLNIVRKVQHSGYEDSWAPARRAQPSFLAQGGALEGLHDLRRGVVLDLNPVVTEKALGGPGAAGWAYDRGTPQLGGNVRWGVTNNLTLNGTARPDFAEVESDAGQFVVDPRFALFFPERRPFFLDGLEQFSVPGNLIYTRRVLEPVAAAKLTGKLAGTSIGFLSAVDDRSVSPGGGDNPVYNVLRAQRDLGAQSRIGMAYTDRVVGADYNRVAGIDGRAVFGGLYSVTGQLAGSLTRTGARGQDGTLWSSAFNRTGRNFGMRWSVAGIDPDFRALSGFTSRTGIVHSLFDHHWTWFGGRGAPVEHSTVGLVVDHTWQYANFVRHGDAQDKKLHLNTSTGLRGGWAIGASVFWETFGFDNGLYAGYQVERTIGGVVDTVPFTGSARIPNRDYVLTLTTPQFKQFNGTLLYVWGQDENFFEWAQANIDLIQASVSFRPGDKVRVEGTLDFQDYRRRTDGTYAGKNSIPRVKVEYQVSRSIFLRVVGEYDLAEHDDLRDESRTFFPLLVDGTRALASKSASFHQDCLFSYRPNPGTVLFVGYGSQADAPPDALNRFTYTPLVRSTDHFFVKFSYLFRT
jgi:hypothetical protein